MALELTVTARGQVTLRRAALDHLGVVPGAKVSVSLLENGRIELIAAAVRDDIKSMRGALRRSEQRPISVEEMQEAIEAGGESVRIAVDTNVLVRYLTWDDERQAIEAANVIEGADAIVVPTIVLCELVRVLKRAYGYAGQEILDILRRIVAIRAVEIERPAAEAGIAMLARGGDFADGVVRHEPDSAKCDRLVTFDQSFARLLGPEKVALLGTQPTQ